MPNVHDTPPTFLFTALRNHYLIYSRLPLLKALIEAGIDTHVAASGKQFASQIEDLGATWHSIDYQRGGLSPLADLRAILRIRKLVKQLTPALVHCVQPKPLVFTALCGHLPKTTQVVTTVTGLGELYALLKGGLAAPFVRRILRLTLRRCARILFLNSDDRAFLLGLGLLQEEKSELLPGEGIELNRFTGSAGENARVNRPIVVLMPCRLLWNKGVGEYVAAARRCLAQTQRDVVFELAGEYDHDHIEAVSPQWVEKQDDAVRYLGYIDDMPNKLASVDIVALPSYCEGMPRTVLEASASGIPVITTSAPGCRESVLNGETGLIVPIRNADALADGLLRLIENDDLRHRMGCAGRAFMERRFSMESVVDRHLKIYQECGLRLCNR